MIKKFFLLFILQIGSAQTLDLEQILVRGDEAFNTGKFGIAKVFFLKATELDSLNKKAWYNLGASELNLGEKEVACEHLYKSFKLGNKGAIEVMKEYCKEFRSGYVVSIKNVDEKPKFISNGESYALYDEKGVNPKFEKILSKEMRYSDTLSKLRGKVFVQFKISKTGDFEGEIINLNAPEQARMKIEIIRLFKKITTYIPAKKDGKVVETWDYIYLPIDFGN